MKKDSIGIFLRFTMSEVTVSHIVTLQLQRGGDKRVTRNTEQGRLCPRERRGRQPACMARELYLRQEREQGDKDNAVGDDKIRIRRGKPAG